MTKTTVYKISALILRIMSIAGLLVVVLSTKSIENDAIRHQITEGLMLYVFCDFGAVLLTQKGGDE